MLLPIIIVFLIIFSGLFAGLLIGYLAREELSPGAKYFEWMKHAIFVAILAYFFYRNQSWLLVIIVAGMIVLLSFSKEYELMLYFSLVPLIMLSALYNGFATIAALSFLYGIPVGSLYLLQSKTNGRAKAAIGLLKKYWGFPILGFALIILSALL